MSIKQTITISYVIIALTVGALGVMTYRHEMRAAEDTASREAVNTARSFVAFALNGQREVSGPLGDAGTLRRFEEHINQFKTAMRLSFVVVDGSKRIVAGASGPDERGLPYTGDAQDEVGQTLQDGMVRLFTSPGRGSSNRARLVVVPLDAAGGSRAGAVILDYSSRYADISDSRKNLGASLLLVYVTGLALLFVAGSVLWRRISRPVQSLKEAALRIAAGDLETTVIPQPSGELRLLAESFNTMTEGLRHLHAELKRSNAELESENGLMKNAEAALRESEQKFRTLFESATDALFILDLDGNFIDANRTAYERLGYLKAEFLSLHISQVDAPEIAARVPERLERLKRMERSESLTFEARHLRKNGTFMPVEINARIMDLSGRKVVFSMVRDITERKLADELVKRTYAQLQTLVRSIPDMVLFKDTEGRHVIVNEAAEKMLGLRWQDIVGKTVDDLLPPEAAAACWKSDREAMAQGKPGHAEEVLRTRNGELRYFDFLKTPITDEKTGMMGLVTIGRDITELKRTEQELRAHREQLQELVEQRTCDLLQANAQLKKEFAERERMETDLIRAHKLESLGILAGGIAHDFNNLLTSVLVNISLVLLDLDEAHPMRKQLVAAERAMLRARDLTAQLLTFSKGGAPVKRTVSVSDIAAESAEFALRGSRTRCELVRKDGLRSVDADEGQLSQVFHNLVLNADQAMPDGGVITIQCENIDFAEDNSHQLPAGTYVSVSVIDRGTGIPKDHLQKIFDPYFTTKQRGSGLGLATTYSIIQKHGGAVCVDSSLGTGSTFTVLLPASGSRPAAPSREDRSVVMGSGRILVMDDEEDVRKITSDVLRRIGYTVDFAGDGAEAMTKYRDAMDAGSRFHAVIMDLTIPGGMGGKETIRMLRDLDPGVKAIVSSGYSDDPVMSDYRTFGFDGAVSKPYRIRDLSATLARLITDQPQE